jgi:hypothetical protein
MPLAYLIRPLHAMVWALVHKLIVSPSPCDHSTDRKHIILVFVRIL